MIRLRFWLELELEEGEGEGEGGAHPPSDSTDVAETSGSTAAPPSPSAPPEATTSAPPDQATLTTSAPPDQATTSAPPETTTSAPADQATTSAPPEATTSAPADQATTSASPETTISAPPDHATTSTPPEATTSAPPDQATTSAPLSYDNRTIFLVTAKYQKPLYYVGKVAYGILWSAMNSETGERVVIKKIARAFRNKVIAKKTLREICILRRMDHDNIIVIRDIIPPQSRQTFHDVYIAYESMDYNLQQVIYSEAIQLSEDQKKLILYQILRGLKYLHSANVLHRDLKPTNLLLSRKCALKIFDFVHARIISQSEMRGDVVASWYRAPELLLNSSAYTAATDVWSVGCVFMEMHNRVVLFQGRGQISHLESIMQLIGSPNEADLGFANDDTTWRINELPHYAPRSFAEVFPGVPPEAIDLAEKMLKFDPRQRITAEEALAHPYLAALHDLNAEPVCTTPLNFDFEQDAAFCEEQAKDIIHAEALDMNPDYRN